MQPRRRRSRRGRPLGVDRLVAVGDGQRCGDVGRQRHLPEPLEGGEHIALVVEDHPSPTIAEVLAHRHDQRGVARRRKACARREATSRAYERLPRHGVEAVEQQHLSGPSGLLHQGQPGREDLRGVEHEEITGFEQVGQVPDLMMPGRPTGPTIDQQAGVVTASQRLLGDRALG